VFPDLSAGGERLHANLITARADDLPPSQVPHLLDHPSHAGEGRRHGRGPSPDRRRLFIEQSPEFFTAPKGLAQAADAAERQPSSLAVTP
jgi:hypothetical protein